MEPDSIRPPLQTFISVDSHASIGNGKPYPKEMREMVMQRHILWLPRLDVHLRLLQLHHLYPSDETMQRWITRYNTNGHFLPTVVVVGRSVLSSWGIGFCVVWFVFWSPRRCARLWTFRSGVDNFANMVPQISKEILSNFSYKYNRRATNTRRTDIILIICLL